MKTAIKFLLPLLFCTYMSAQSVLTSGQAGMKCDGTTDDSSRMQNALATLANATAGTLVIEIGQCVIGGNLAALTVASNVTLDFTEQGSLSIKSGGSLTVAGGIVDYDAHQVIFGSGTFTYTGTRTPTCAAWTGGGGSCLGSGGGGTPGGSNTQIQYNNAGAFGGDSNLTWNSASKIFTLGLSPISLISPDPTGFVNQILSIPDTGINLTGDASFDGNINIHNVFADGISMYVHSDTGFRGPTLNLYKSGGTQASPTVAAAVLGYVNFGGWDG